MKKILLVTLFAATLSFAQTAKEMLVYKTPYCGCCTKWTEIMQKNGIDVKVRMVNDVNSVNNELGINPSLASCHTAIIDNYIVIGHVDYSAVKKMLEEKPDIVGITVPGMPIGSPGMEQGDVKQAYNVLSIKKDGSTAIYEKH